MLKDQAINVFLLTTDKSDMGPLIINFYVNTTFTQHLGT